MHISFNLHSQIQSPICVSWKKSVCNHFEYWLKGDTGEEEGYHMEEKDTRQVRYFFRLGLDWKVVATGKVTLHG